MNYRENHALNWSKIKHIKTNPRLVKRLLEKEDTEDNDAFKLGRVFHCMILEPENFKETFAPAFEDTCQPAIRKVVEHIYYSKWDFSMENVVNAARIVGYQSNWKDKTIYDKVVELNGKEYFNYLKKYEDMDVEFVPQEIVDKANDMKYACMPNYMFYQLFVEERSDMQVFNEKEVYCNMFGMDLKAKIDRIVVDHDKKVIHIIELKTTGSLVSGFEAECEKYGYKLQLAFYRMMVEKTFDLGTYDINQWIVAVESIGDYDMGVFKVKEQIKNMKEVESYLEDMKWHLENNYWAPKRLEDYQWI